MTIRHPQIRVKISGYEGDGFLLGRVRSALRREGITEEEVTEFTDECLDSGVKETIGKWVTAE